MGTREGRAPDDRGTRAAPGGDRLSRVRVSLPRLRDRLERLAAIGAGPEGGITRLPFMPPHLEAMRTVLAMMREAGLEAGLDEFGNVVGVLSGRDGPPAVLSGSHLDTVPAGGMFDGALGVIAAIECAQALSDAGVRLRHAFAVIAFADEEGAGFGLGTLSSRALLGEIPREHLEGLSDEAGRRLVDHLAAVPRLFGPPTRIPSDARAYIELHAEQGPVLHRLGATVAAVDAITGTLRTTVAFNGHANHAGTTPMDARRDALWGAADLIVAVRELARATGGRAVGTVGRVDAFPGVTNVVAGRAAVRVDLRSPDEEQLQALRRQVEDAADEIAARHGLEVTAETWDHARATPMDSRVRDAILEAMHRTGHGPLVLPSWAGHDAKVLADHVPSGMIFVTSTDGISHSPQEHTPWAAVEVGAQVLLETTLAIDRWADEGRILPLAYRP